MDTSAKVITHIQGEKYSDNPRQITRKQFERLKADLSELGDLFGVVHDLNSNQFIGGNQRSEAFNINNCEIELVEQYAQPDAQGTVAHGLIIWQGGRYAYRQVRWTEQQCRAANIKANLDGGSWDIDVLSGWDTDELIRDGMDQDTLHAWNNDAAALRELLTSSVSMNVIDDGDYALPHGNRNEPSGKIVMNIGRFAAVVSEEQADGATEIIKRKFGELASEALPKFLEWVITDEISSR